MAVAYKNSKLVDVGTSYGDAYTCPSSTTALVRGIHISNKISDTDQTIYVEWTDASASNAAVSIAEAHVIPQKASYQVLDGMLVLEAGDKIKVKAGTGSTCDVTVSVLESS